MERLTKTYSDGTHGAADNLPCGENSYEYKGLLLEALGKYEDAEEQGLLLRLPCGIGDTLYTIYTCEDVEEVLDGIMTSPVNKDCFGEECRASDCTVCLICKAIEIVKGGGVDA